jgi:hypothetical protein
MNTAVTSRLAAALLSVLVTVFVLDAIATYAHQSPAKSEAQIARNSMTFVAVASK